MVCGWSPALSRFIRGGKTVSRKNQLDRKDASKALRHLILQQPNWTAVSAAAEAAAEKLYPDMPVPGTGALIAWVTQLVLWLIPYLLATYTADDGRSKIQSMCDAIVNRIADRPKATKRKRIK